MSSSATPPASDGGAGIVSDGGRENRTAAALPRTVGFIGASGVMIGVCIGSGIFNTPPQIAGQISGLWLTLLCWGVGGVLALFGAMTYAEMGAMFPQSGGVYVFLREAYGRAAAFVFGWSYMLISKPLAAAGIATVFSSHLLALFGGVPKDASGAPMTWVPIAVTCVLLIVSTWLNARGTALGARVATGLTALKIAGLLGIVVAACVVSPGAVEFTEPAIEKTTVVGALVMIFAAVMWTYDGWADVGAIAGDVKEPSKTLPRVFILGTLGIMAIYLSVNAAYFALLPEGAIRSGSDSNPMAEMVGASIAGSAGAAVLLGLVALSTLGSTHGSILTGARVTFQQARDGLMFRFLGSLHPTRKTPAAALWVQCALSCASVMVYQTFSTLAGGFVFSMWLFYTLAGTAIFVLRFKRPDAPRPFRCWGYPVVPGLFVLAGASMTVLTMTEKTGEKLVWLAILLAGFPVYAVWSRLAKDESPPDHGANR